MKRMVFFAVSALAAIVLAAPTASAQSVPQGPVCIPEALWLHGPGGTAMCTAGPIPSINPPFTAYSESNGSQEAWCLYSQPSYVGFVARVPAFSGANAWVTVASVRPC